MTAILKMIPPKNIIESLFGIKVSKTGNIILNGIILLLILIAFWQIPKLSKKQSLKLKESWNISSFNGVVDSITKDNQNHAVTTIFLKNKDKICCLSQTYYYSLKTGDSIYKIKNNDTIFVNRNRRIFK